MKDEGGWIKDECVRMKVDGGRQKIESSTPLHPSSSYLPSSAPPATLADAEREHILGVLRASGWVLGGPKGAAARLGMKRSTLHWKMKKLNIARPD